MNHHHLALYVFSCWVCSVDANNQKQKKNRRPDESHLMAGLFLSVTIHD